LHVPYSCRTSWPLTPPPLQNVQNQILSKQHNIFKTFLAKRNAFGFPIAITKTAAAAVTLGWVNSFSKTVYHITITFRSYVRWGFLQLCKKIICDETKKVSK
jgi:hypothetical protein